MLDLMKKTVVKKRSPARTLSFVCAVVFLLGVRFGVASDTAPDVVRLAFSNIQNYPIQMGYGQALADPPGITVELIQLAFQRENISLEIVRYPNKRVLLSLETNEIDGAFVFSYNADRAKFCAYPLKEGKPDESRRVTELKYHFYKHKENSAFGWDGKTVTPADATVTAVSGYSVVKELNKLNIEVAEIKKPEAGFEMVRRGYVAATAGQSSDYDPLIKDNDFSFIERVDPPIKKKDYFLVFSKKFAQEHPEVADRIWQTLAVVREEHYARLVEKYRAVPP